MPGLSRKCQPVWPWPAAAALVLVAACARESAPRAGALDDHGRPIPALATPRRIVSLGPSTTEILYTLGAGDRLVGRSRWDRWPDDVRSVSEVGDAIRPSVERILALQPDVVFLYAAADNRAAGDALTRAGVPAIALRVDSIGQYLHAVALIGDLLGVPARADSIVRALRAQLDTVRTRTASRPRVTVFLPAWDEPLMTLGSGSYLSELVEIAGGRNVYAERHEPSLVVAMEDVVRRDPDIVLTTPVSAARIGRDPSWQVLRAVREGRVLAYDTLLVSQPSSRLGDAAASLARLLHPH